MHELKTEHLFHYQASLEPPQIIGPVAEGIRVNFWVSGGIVEGPRVRGRLQPRGADFFTLRPDGVGELHVRGVIETHDGALIDLTYDGLSDLGADAYQAFLAGELPPQLALHTAPRLRCAQPAYAALSRCLCIGVGVGDLNALTVSYDVYAVR